MIDEGDILDDEDNIVDAEDDIVDAEDDIKYVAKMFGQPCSDHFLCRYFDGDPQTPFYLEESPSFAVEDIVHIFFDVDENRICTKQPIGCRKSATFVVDVRSLGHCDDIRADDLGVWDNKGVRRNYFSISFGNSGNIRRLRNLGTKPPTVQRKAIYSLKRIYWRHNDEQQFS